MKEILTEQELLEHIKKLIEEKGGQKAFAGFLKMSSAYLCDIFHGNRPISKKLAKKLGWEKVWRQTKIGDKNA
jgi:hypothetical protein